MMDATNASGLRLLGLLARAALEPTVRHARLLLRAREERLTSYSDSVMKLLLSLSA
jgi:hypothetical protein